MFKEICREDSIIETAEFAFGMNPKSLTEEIFRILVGTFITRKTQLESSASVASCKLQVAKGKSSAHS